MLKYDVQLCKKAGGTIIHQKPVFSYDCRTLFIGYGAVLRSFSTITGDHIRDFELFVDVPSESHGNITDIVAHPFKKNGLLCCFEMGTIVTWCYEIRETLNNYKLHFKKSKIVAAMKVVVLPNKPEAFDFVVAVKDRQSSPKAKIQFYSNEDGTLKYSCNKVFKFDSHSWSATGVEGKGFVAFINVNRLTIINVQKYKYNNDIIIGNERYYTCVACHPTRECVAAGDNTGRVLLYYKFIDPNNKSPFSVFHWHTLAVNDIAFTKLGSHFYSGGNEHVLVKWTLSAPDRSYLPRLSAPVVHVTVSHYNELIAVSTLDNSILIVSPQLNITCCIQQFSWCFTSTPEQKLFPCGLNVDLRSNCLVTNGRPGHIQFYSPQYSMLQYQIDVCEENFVSPERDDNIPNSEVIALQFSSDGMWLATSQICRDPKFPSDTILKLWRFDRKSQLYKSEVNAWSRYEITKILFQPVDETVVDEVNPEYLLATLCSDNKFRMWIGSSVFNAKSTKTRIAWRCSSVGYYRDHQLSDISFSNDGSILGATFGPCLTVWYAESNTMKYSIIRNNEPIRKIVFGNGDCSFIVVSATDTNLTAYNLLSLTIMWSLSLHVSIIVSDPLSSHIAVFTDKNKLFVFNLMSSLPVYEYENVCTKNGVSVSSAVFFPDNKKKIQSKSSWLSNSSLYFVTSEQALMMFKLKTEIELEQHLESDETYTGMHFSGYKSTNVVSEVKKPASSQYLQLKSPWTSVLAEYLESPAHTMPPVHSTCESILRSFLIKR